MSVSKASISILSCFELMLFMYRCALWGHVDDTLQLRDQGAASHPRPSGWDPVSLVILWNGLGLFPLFSWDFSLPV